MRESIQGQGETVRRDHAGETPDPRTSVRETSCSSQFELRRRNGFIVGHSNSKTKAIEAANSIARREGIPIAVHDLDGVVYRALPDAAPDVSKRGHNQGNAGTRSAGRPVGIELEPDDEQAITDLAALLESRMLAEHEAQSTGDAERDEAQ